MISEKVQKAINGQINMELFSSYLYLAMSAHFDSRNLVGFGHWMRLQAQEELTHAMKLYDYLLERAGRVTLQRVEAPEGEWPTALAAFEEAYEHETKNTGQINELVGLAQSEKDHATAIFLQWFVTEQVEEEASASRLVEKIKMVSGSPEGIFLIDRELAQRA